MGHAARDADGSADEDGPAVTTRLCISAAMLALTPGLAVAQSWRTITSARQPHGERELTVNVRYGAGRLHLTPGTGGELYRMEMRYDEDKFVPVREYDAAGPALRLGLRSRDGNGMRVSLGDRNRDPTSPPSLDLSLTPDIPLTLNLELGAVETDAELGALALRRVSFRTGASRTFVHFTRSNPVACEELTMAAGAAEFHADALANANCARVAFHGGVGDVTLDFGGTWRRSMTADITVGIGSLKLRLPRDVGVSVHLNRFLASFDAAGLEKRGRAYYSANYASARYRLALNVHASIGGVEVAWTDR